MKVTCELTNLSEVINKLNSLKSRINAGMAEVIQEVTDSTKIVCQEKTPVNTGVMQNSYESYVTSGESKANGYILNTDDDSLYVHYGTGIYATMEHIGTSEGFVNSGGTRWFVTVENFPQYQKYNYPIKVFNNMGVQLLEVHGQKPNPFMKTAFDETLEKNISIAESIIKEICGV